MKKAIRIISVVLLAVMVSTLLCSCIPLDNLKNNRAVWLNDEETEALFRDNLYRLIPLKDNAIIQNESYIGVITKADVPILMAQSEGKALYYDSTVDVPVILKARNDTSVSGYEYYCLDSEYDRISQINANHQYDSMYITYIMDDDEDDSTDEWFYEYKYVYEIISEEYQDAIDRALSSSDVISDYETDYHADYIDVERCDSEMILSDFDNIHIERFDNEFYVLGSKNYSYRKALDSDKEIFKRMFAEYKGKGAVQNDERPLDYEGY